MSSGPFSFVVPGDPVPKGRPRTGNGFVYTPAKTREAEHRVKVHARLARVRPLLGDVALEVKFYRATKRRVDCDNLLKLVSDGLNGIAFRDDSQIVRAVAEKFLDPENPRTEVVVRAAHVATEESPLDTPASSLRTEGSKP